MFWFSQQFFFPKHLVLWSFQRDIIINVHGISCKGPVICHILNILEFFRQILKPQISISWKSIQWELSCSWRWARRSSMSLSAILQTPLIKFKSQEKSTLTVFAWWGKQLNNEISPQFQKWRRVETEQFGLASFLYILKGWRFMILHLLPYSHCGTYLSAHLSLLPAVQWRMQCPMDPCNGCNTLYS